MISAPAGYGKTTLLRQFVDEVPSVAGWVTLDRADRDATVLLNDVRAAVGLPKATPPSRRLDWYQSALLLCSQLNDIGDASILILDDYHEVDGEPEIGSLMCFLLDNLPEQATIVLSSRTGLRPLGLPDLTVKRRVFRLSKQDLRLTLEEARALLQKLHGRRYAAAEARRLWDASEGWPAGLMLIAGEGEIAANALRKLDVAEYFSKILCALDDDELRDFLLNTSILELIVVPVCDRLLSMTNSEAVLEELCRRNLFIERLELDPPAYRYHGLFRDFLYGELRRRDQLRLRELHRQAGVIYLSKRDTVTAARHFIASTDYLRAARALGSVAPRQLVEAPVIIAELLDSIPAEVFEHCPRALLTRAKLHYRAGDMNNSVDAASKAFLMMHGTGDITGMAEAEVLRATALKHRGETRLALRACHNALKLLEDEGAHSIQAEALLQTGICKGLQGRLLEAKRALMRARNIWVNIGEIEREGVTSEALGSVFMELGEPARAQAYYERAYEAWANLGDELACTRVLLNTASLYMRQGEQDAACEVLESVFAKLRLSYDRHLEAIAWVNLAELKRDVQLYDEADPHYLTGQQKARECLDTWLSLYAAEGRATLLRLLGHIESAKRLLSALLPEAETLGDLASGIVLISLAAVDFQRGSYDEARRQIERAIGVLGEGREGMELARAHFWRARLAFRAGQLEEVRHALKQTASNLRRVYILPLSDLRGAQRLLQYAIATGIEPEFFARMMRKARTRHFHLAKRGGPRAHKQAQLSPASALTLFALGEAKVQVGGRSVPEAAWRSEKAKELLFFLAWQNKAMRRAEIESELWPDFDEARANTNFRVSVFRARQATFPTAIIFSAGRYGLNRDVPPRLDAREFIELVNSARRFREESSERIRMLETACKLYRGPVLERIDSEWCVSLRNDLELRYVSVLVEMADYHHHQGKHEEAAITYEQAIEINPLLEAAHEGLIRSSIARGDFAAARHHYRRYQVLLNTELNEQPPEHLRRLIS